jgi:hypothetical protein
MHPRSFLRLEGLTVLCAALVGYVALGGPIWLLALLALAPDVAMLGYLAGPRIGSLSYNVAHTYALPLSLGAVGLWLGVDIAVLVALVWAGHIGADRLVGYGLKFDSGFNDTHLSPQSAADPVTAGK